jgi:hypothetical protein
MGGEASLHFIFAARTDPNNPIGFIQKGVKSTKGVINVMHERLPPKGIFEPGLS